MNCKNKALQSSGKRSVYYFLLLCLWMGLYLTPFTGVAQSLSASDTSEVRFINSRKFYLYKVGKGETLFSISQKFKIPQEELVELNPDLKNGVKAKMKLWIPAYSWKGKTDGAGPTEVKSSAKKEQKEITVALISSLELGKIYTGEPNPDDSAHTREAIDRQSLANLEFTEGALLALDEIHTKYPSFRIRSVVLDSESDTARINRFAWKQELKGTDLFVTNETGHLLKSVNKLAKRNNAVLVSCGVNSADSIRQNPSALSVLPSSALQCRKMGEFCARKFSGANVILVKTGVSKENERIKSFREGWADSDNRAAFRTADYNKGFSKAVCDSLRKGRQNIIFVPSSNEDLVTTLLTALKENKTDYNFNVIGLPTWYGFETVDPALLQECGVYFFNSGFVDHNVTRSDGFRKSFRDKYATEPGESAFIGYDAVYFAVDEFRKGGGDSFKRSGSKSFNGLYTEYRFTREDNDDCLENQHIIVWTFRDKLPVQVDE